MNLLSLDSSTDFGGLERFQLAVASGMAARGHRVEVAGTPGSRFLEAASERGLPTHPIRFHGYVSPLGVARLARLIRRGSFDVLHYCLSRNIWAAAPAARLAGRKSRVVHSLQMTPGGRLDGAVHRWLRGTLGAFVVPTPRTSVQAAGVWGMDTEEPVVIPNFVEQERFEQSGLQEAARAMRAAWGHAADETVVGMLGRLEPAKGVGEFVDAALSLQDTSAKFVVAGPVSAGSEAWAASLRGRVAAARAGDRIVFAGPQDRVPVYMQALDLFVMPSHRETFGLVLVEAMMAGCAVVATHGPGPDFILDEGRCGPLVPVGDAPALAEALRGLIDATEERNRLATLALRRAQSTFSDRVVLPIYEDLFRRVAGA